ncbi:MAG: M48 family metalloprotease [Roseovarius sp.]
MHVLRFFPAAVALTVALAVAVPARALTLLRDPDIEYALERLAQPVLRAAGLGATRLDIMVVDDPGLNAFVVDRNNIFIHSGLLLKMTRPAMLQAVIAHEAAHIANGHLARRPINMRNARTAAGIGAALAAAAAVASGEPGVAGAGALGAASISQRLFFAHTQAEENAADQSGVRFMAAAGLDPQGMVEVLDIFRGQELLGPGRQDPYVRTHPLSRDRYRVVQRLAGAYAAQLPPGSDDPVSAYWFQRARGKLSAYERAPKWTLNRLGESGHDDIAAMREAVARHRQADTAGALAAIDRALALRPEDPYYLELKGQILFESRRFTQAVAAYGAAVRLAPKNALILGSYGRALLAAGQTAEAVRYLQQSYALDGRDPRVLRDLAQAYAAQDNRGMAALVTAERYAMGGQMADAGIHARRASDLLPRGSPGWLRAQDVLAAAELAAKTDKKRRR